MAKVARPRFCWHALSAHAQHRVRGAYSSQDWVYCTPLSHATLLLLLLLLLLVLLLLVLLQEPLLLQHVVGCCRHVCQQQGCMHLKH